MNDKVRSAARVLAEQDDRNLDDLPERSAAFSGALDQEHYLFRARALLSAGLLRAPEGKDLDAEFEDVRRRAANLGYLLMPEPEHPDSPHAPASKQAGGWNEGRLTQAILRAMDSATHTTSPREYAEHIAEAIIAKDAHYGASKQETGGEWMRKVAKEIWESINENTEAENIEVILRKHAPSPSFEAGVEAAWNAVNSLIRRGHLDEPAHSQRNGLVLAANAIRSLSPSFDEGGEWMREAAREIEHRLDDLRTMALKFGRDAARAAISDFIARHALSPSFEAGVEAAARVADAEAEKFKQMFDGPSLTPICDARDEIDDARRRDTWNFGYGRMRRLASAIRSLSPQQGEGWLPIETAPKDGTLIVALCWNVEPYWDEDNFWIASWDGKSWQPPSCSEPTGWRPLPSPPSRKEGE